ncbi:MAG: hypothetical protein KJ906_00220 [Nanoarchaeota archaeon]|nr:hypothetical protein [Nanoarchaeota archaeon]
MKGSSLPINMLIILLIAIVVLIASLAMFTNVFGQSSSGLQLDAAKNSGCQKFISLNGCTGDVTAADITINEVKCGQEEGDKVTDHLDELITYCFNSDQTGIEICNC